ncbi:MAG: caspase family protein, partial [Candidatus Latescibacterota bacterium]
GSDGEVHYRRDLEGNAENTFELGKMPSGSDRDVLFYFFTNPTFRGKNVHISIDVTEARARQGISKALSFDIGQSVPTEEVLAVQSVQERRGKVSLVQAQWVDVDEPPSGSKTKLSNGIAIIFGIETYKNTFPAAYKNRDATVFYKYCRDVLGIPEERIYLSTDDNATKGEFDYVFEPKGTSNEGWLKKRMKNPNQVQETDIFVYMGGHGFPDLSTGKPYFIPYDIRPEQATNGISMEVLYQGLSEFDARSVMVFVESCFSGASAYEKGMKEQLLALNMNPVFPTLESPLVGKRMVVFTATSGKKPSNNRDDLKHGIFTYFLLKGLGGSADGNGDKTVTVGELYSYLSKQVPKKALEAPLDREQIPQIRPGLSVLGGMENQILVEY